MKDRWSSRALVVAFLASLALALPGTVRADSSSDARVAAIAQTYFAASFAESPTSATGTGVHAFDDRLDDVSFAAYDARIGLDEKTLDALDHVSPSTLSPDAALDRTMLRDQLLDDLLLQKTLLQWRHNPDQYVGTASGAIFGLIKSDFAPLRTRMIDAIARERQLPHFFRQARANISSVDATTKTISLSDARGSVGFFTDTVPAAFASVRDARLQSELKVANTAAAAAMRGYAAFIASIRPSGTYAIGKAAYEARLRYEDELDIPLADYLAAGERALARTRAQFIATSRLIDPTKSPVENYKALAKRHPAPSQLNATAARDLVELRRFLIARHIITLPPDADITVVDTPPFERAFVTASMDSPGPLETVATRAFYNVTPVDPNWSTERKEGFLAQFNDAQRPIISAHEVYPGHFVNYTIDKHLKLSLTRKLLWSSEMGEGWAHYGEQMMVDEGWGGGDPHVRLAQLEEAMLRECRYIVGVKLHTEGWSLAQAEHLFTGQCFQTPAVALEESLRGTQDPMYGYYTLGKLMILKLRDDYKKKMGAAYTLQGFHDALLAQRRSAGAVVAAVSARRE